MKPEAGAGMLHISRVGQKDIFAVYIQQYGWQGNHQLYGVKIRFWPTLHMCILLAVILAWGSPNIQSSKYTVHGAYLQFWPNLHISQPTILRASQQRTGQRTFEAVLQLGYLWQDKC